MKQMLEYFMDKVVSKVINGLLGNFDRNSGIFVGLSAYRKCTIANSYPRDLAKAGKRAEHPPISGTHSPILLPCPSSILFHPPF